jgi:hypothetical protein
MIKREENERLPFLDEEKGKKKKKRLYKKDDR